MAEDQCDNTGCVRTQVSLCGLLTRTVLLEAPVGLEDEDAEEGEDG